MGTLYVDTGGATTNSGCTDSNTPDLTGSAATVSGSVVTLDGSPDLSGLVTSGDTQSSIYIDQATNSNMKIFWITAFDNSAKTVTVHAAPTGVTSSSWTIGGRHLLTNAYIEGAVRGGDTVIFNNSPAATAGNAWRFRNAGDASTGLAKIKGKDGVRPVLESTTGNRTIEALTWTAVENFEIIASGTGDCVQFASGISGAYIKNCKIDCQSASGKAILATGALRIIGCDIKSLGSYGIGMVSTNQPYIVDGCYIHDCGAEGILISAVTSVTITNTIVDSCAGRGIHISNTGVTANNLSRFTIQNCTVYGCGDSGLEVNDVDAVVTLTNSIFMNNGDAAGEYNVELTAGGDGSSFYHAYNCFYKSSNNLSGVTADASDITSDPLFVDAANGDFRLGTGSPCLGTGYPGTFLNGPVSTINMGAVQNAGVASGGETSHTFVG